MFSFGAAFKAQDTSAMGWQSADEALRSVVTLCGEGPRKQLEWLRSKLQESEQARGAGIHLGAPGVGVWSPSDSDWLSAARMGRRRRAVAATVLADASVR